MPTYSLAGVSTITIPDTPRGVFDTYVLAILNPAINANSSGAGTVNFTVPQSIKAFTVTSMVAVVAGSPGALISGNLAVIDADTLLLIAPDSNGVYSVVPGQHLTFLYSFFNVTADNAVPNSFQATLRVTKEG